MTEPLISIIMPAYNAEIYIQQSIRSVLRQSYKNWELIIIDDGSTDNTYTMVKPLLVDKRITYYFQQNGRQGKARNTGILKSKGNYIAFLDADDLWESEKLYIQMNVLRSDFTVDLVFCQGYTLTEKIKTNYNVCVKPLWKRENSLTDLVNGNQIPLLAVLVKRQCLINVGLFSEHDFVQNAEDYHLWLKLLIYGYKFKSTCHRLFSYRIHAAQVTFQNYNIEKPIFYAYKDLFYMLEDSSVRKLFLQKMIWQVFRNEFHIEVSEITQSYFKDQQEIIASFLVNIARHLQKGIASKIIFHTVRYYA